MYLELTTSVSDGKIVVVVVEEEERKQKVREQELNDFNAVTKLIMAFILS